MHEHRSSFSLHSSLTRPVLQENRLNHSHVRYISTFIEAIGMIFLCWSLFSLTSNVLDCLDEATLSNPEDTENRLPVTQRYSCLSSMYRAVLISLLIDCNSSEPSATQIENSSRKHLRIPVLSKARVSFRRDQNPTLLKTCSFFSHRKNVNLDR